MLKGVFICFLVTQLVFLTEGKIKEMKQGSCTETCLQDIYDSVTFNRDKVGNYLRQKARLENFLKVQSKKLDKKDDYAVFAEELAAGLGGNSTNFICGVKNQGTQLNNATETYKFLQSCSSSIVASCTKDTTMISPEIEAELAACETKMLEFQAKVEDCLKQSTSVTDTTVSSTCTCWAEAVVLVNGIKDQKCDASGISNDVKKTKNACVSEIIACKKSQFNIPGLLAECQVDLLNADKSIDEILNAKEFIGVDTGAFKRN